jgi:hypothetical protein
VHADRSAAAVAEEKVPEGHCLQDALSMLSEYVPAAQDVHSDAPLSTVKVPAGQLEHLL